jgi:hypothetical protein
MHASFDNTAEVIDLTIVLVRDAGSKTGHNIHASVS